MPGRPQRRAQKRKQAASTCHRLDEFIPPKRSATLSSSDGSEEASLQTAVGTTSSSSFNQETPFIQAGLPTSSMAAVSEQPLAISMESLNQVLPSEHATQTQPATCPTGVVDIGEIFQTCPSDFRATMNSLTSSQKYNLLTNHKKNHEHHQFLHILAAVIVVSDMSG